MPRKIANGRIKLRSKHFALRRRDKSVVYASTDFGGGSGRLATLPAEDAAEKRGQYQIEAGLQVEAFRRNSLQPDAGSALARAWS